VIVAVILTAPLMAGFQLQVATRETVVRLMQPPMRFPLAQKVTFPAVDEATLMLLRIPLMAAKAYELK
jgi:hypothetical protein